MNKLMKLANQICMTDDVDGCDLMEVETHWLQSAVDEMRKVSTEIQQLQHRNAELEEWKNKTQALAASVVFCGGRISDKSMSEMTKILADRDSDVKCKTIEEYQKAQNVCMANALARQAEESYKKGSADIATAIADGIVSINEISLLSFWSGTQAKQHAAKIRKGNDESSCHHEWVSAENERVKGVYICSKCQAICSKSQLDKGGDL